MTCPAGSGPGGAVARERPPGSGSERRLLAALLALAEARRPVDSEAGVVWEAVSKAA